MGRHRSNSSGSPVRERRSPRRRSPSRRSPHQVSSPVHNRSSLRDSGSSPARERSPGHKSSHNHRGRSPEKQKHSSHARSPKQGSSLSPASCTPSPRTKRKKRAQAERENEKVKDSEPERNYSRGKERNPERERVSYREAEKETEKVRGRELDSNHNRGNERNSERERKVIDREAERETEKVKGRELERNHNRGKERNSERERASDRAKVVERERGREIERGMERETVGEKRERQSERDHTNGKSSRGRYGHSTSPSDRRQRHKNRSRSPLPGYDSRNGEEVMNSRGSDQRNDNDDSVAKMNAAEAALQAKKKQQPSFELSGKLAEETNRVRGVTLLFNEPPEARKPDIRWRLYVFKAGEVLNEPLYIHRQSCYLFGRERRVADIPTDHPSCSKQHAVIQFRLVEKETPDGMASKQVRPYLMDLGSTNKTYLNENPIEPQRYYELFEKDTIKFGNSRFSCFSGLCYFHTFPFRFLQHGNNFEPRVCAAAREFCPVTDGWVPLYVSTSPELGKNGNGLVIYIMIARIVAKIWNFYSSLLLLPCIITGETLSLSYLRLMQQTGCS